MMRAQILGQTLVALAALAAIATGLPASPRGGRVRREGLSERFSRVQIVHDLSVADATTGAIWTGLAADGSEIETMPKRLRVSFMLHGELRTLEVARAETMVAPNYRELVLEIPPGSTALPTNLSEALKPGPELGGGGRRRRAGPRRRRTALDCL